MLEALKRFAVLSLTVCAAISYADAQPRSVGASFSFSALGATYEHTLNQDSFINADIKAEMGPYFMDSTRLPGVSASLSGNFIISRWASRNGNTICAFAGPGITAGIAHEFKKDYGYFLGLKGRLGMECLFERKVSISISLAPTLGMHMTIVEGHLEMRYYKGGLINAMIPEIGIKYLF